MILVYFLEINWFFIKNCKLFACALACALHTVIKLNELNKKLQELVQAKSESSCLVKFDQWTVFSSIKSSYFVGWSLISKLSKIINYNN